MSRYPLPKSKSFNVRGSPLINTNMMITSFFEEEGDVFLTVDPSKVRDIKPI